MGWDFPLTANKELVFRPIFNASLGNVSSDLSVGKFAVEQVTDRQINFLDGGSLNAYGLGGSVMLDWEHYREDYEIDVELRYTSIHLQSFGGTTSSVTGTATAQTANLWARWRAQPGCMRSTGRYGTCLNYHIHTTLAARPASSVSIT